MRQSNVKTKVKTVANKPDDQERMFKRLAETLSRLAGTIDASVEQRKIEFEWQRSHCGLATKHDLEQMESRLIDAIVRNTSVGPAVEAAILGTQAALDAMDAVIPDKKTV